MRFGVSGLGFNIENSLNLTEGNTSQNSKVAAPKRFSSQNQNLKQGLALSVAS